MKSLKVSLRDRVESVIEGHIEKFKKVGRKNFQFSFIPNPEERKQLQIFVRKNGLTDEARKFVIPERIVLTATRQGFFFPPRRGDEVEVTFAVEQTSKNNPSGLWATNIEVKHRRSGRFGL